jgi:hypothetical protein
MKMLGKFHSFLFHRDAVQETIDLFQTKKGELSPEELEKVKFDLKRLQRDMDTLWNTLYWQQFDKFEKDKGFFDH